VKKVSNTSNARIDSVSAGTAPLPPDVAAFATRILKIARDVAYGDDTNGEAAAAAEDGGE
jgi:hypothetical protein